MDWIETALANAKSKTPSGHDEVWTRLEQMIRGKLRERQLPTGELKLAAKELAAIIIPAETTPEVEK